MSLANPSRKATMIGSTSSSSRNSNNSLTNSHLILVSSILFLLAALMQLATAWLQSKHREALQLGCVATDPSAGREWERVEIAGVSTSESWEDDYSAWFFSFSFPFPSIRVGRDRVIALAHFGVCDVCIR